MRVFVAGAAGALGAPVVMRLVADGHEVTGLTRTLSNAEKITKAGGKAVVGDALNSAFLKAVVVAAKPEVVVHALTAIPARGPLRPSDLKATNALRIHGTRHLLDAARAAGARRFVAESMVFVYGFGDLGMDLLTEQCRVPQNVPKDWLRPTIEALTAEETQVLEATHLGQIDGILLRFGAFYGPGAGLEVMAKLLLRRLLWLPSNPRGKGVPWIHIHDAAAAVVSAVSSQRSGEIYNIADDRPTRFKDLVAYLAQVLDAPVPPKAPMWALRLFAPFAATAMFDTTLGVSNAKAKHELGWVLRYPNCMVGIHEFAHPGQQIVQSSA